MNRGAIHYTTILQRKAGRMIWAHDAISYKFTFGKRPAKVGARVSHGEDTVSATNEQNRQALMIRGCSTSEDPNARRLPCQAPASLLPFVSLTMRSNRKPYVVALEPYRPKRIHQSSICRRQHAMTRL
jgi:hypothetical protein